MTSINQLLSNFQIIEEQLVEQMNIVDSTNLKKRVMNELNRLTGGFVLTEKNKILLNLLFDYFTHNFYSKFKLNRGILLIGDVGTGKTTLLKAFRILSNYNFITAQEIVKLFSQIGMDAVNNINYELSGFKNYDGSATYRNFDLCIDDIGANFKNYNYYSNKIPIFEEIFISRYDIWQNTGHVTHASLNSLDALDELTKRTKDRVQEMFNIICIKDSNFRNIEYYEV